MKLTGNIGNTIGNNLFEFEEDRNSLGIYSAECSLLIIVLT